MADRASALTVPTGRVSLAHCGSCGFVTNTSFDASLFDYTAVCEDSQASSEAFDRWSRGLAREWVDRYGLHGGRVVEVGCGKGDFLVALVEAGVGHGVGIDPAAQPGRHDGPAARRLEWINEPYSRDHARLTADALVCRHTLEHVPDVADFVGLIAATHARTPAVTVLVEVPDTVRVVRAGAFWDIYHEHCSYFSPASLTELFTRAGFVVEEARCAFDDQYLLLTARRSDGDRAPPVLAATSAVGSDDFARFSRRCDQARADWEQRVTEAAARGTVVVWGAGSKAVAFLSALGPAAGQVGYAVDINPRKWGHFLPGSGHPVLPPEATADDGPEAVIVMNPVYVEEIGAALAEYGQTPQLLALGAESGDR